MSKTSRIIYLFVSFLFFLYADFYLTNLILENGYKLPSNPIFELTFIQNHGAAFNILQGSQLFLVTFAVIAIIGILAYTIKHARKASGIALFCSSILCAGIFCNMYERITLGYVRDFIKLNFIDFPIFNLSDIFINISVFVIVIIIIKNNYVKKS